MTITKQGNDADQMAVRQWVERYIRANTEEECRQLYECPPLQADALFPAFKATVERQRMALGKSQFEINLFSIPVSITGDTIEKRWLSFRNTIPVLMSAFRRNGYLDAGGGVMLMRHLVQHQDLAACSPSDLREIGREIFKGGTLRRERIPDESILHALTPDIEVTPMAGTVWLGGHLIGCRYRKVGITAMATPKAAALDADLQAILRAHFTERDGPYVLEIGSMLPIYDAVEACMSMRSRYVAYVMKLVADELGDGRLEVRVSSADDPYGTSISVVLFDGDRQVMESRYETAQAERPHTVSAMKTLLTHLDLSQCSYGELVHKLH